MGFSLHSSQIPLIDTMSQYAHLSTPDPEFLELASKLPAAPQGPMTVASVRHLMHNMLVPQVLDTLRPQLPAGSFRATSLVNTRDHSFTESAYRVQDRQIAVEAGEITVRCIQPVPRDDESGGFPVLVWMHGGGGHFMFLSSRLTWSNDFAAQAGSLGISTWTISTSES